MRGSFHLHTGLTAKRPQPLSRPVVLVDHRINLERIHLSRTEPIQGPTDVCDQLTEARFVIRRHAIPGSLPLRL
ncbi:hypothetical protein ACIP5Y_10685 [Nocardia sp. NPDC088792]|uniref:hypothetical protein n=1 Tax=Nocardia sp. NPDC088792 TaxID=3364332 RepID=UPI0038044767